MAITRTQIAKQLLEQGGRVGLQGGGADMGKERGSVTGREPGPVGGGRGVRGDRNPMAQFSPEAAAIAKEMRDATMGAGDRFVPDFFPIAKGLANMFQVKKPTPFDIQRKGFIQALGPKPLEANRDSNDFIGDTPLWAQLGFNSEAEYLASLEAQETMDQESEIEEDEGLLRRFRANGGSTNDISLEEAKDMAPKGEFLAYINEKEAKMLKDAGGSGIMTNAGIPSFVEYGGRSGFDSAKSTGSVQGDIDRGSGGGPPTNVGGGVTNIPSKKDIPTINTDFTRFNKQDLINLGLVDPDENKTITVADALTIPTEGKLGLNLVDYSTLKNTGYTDTQISELQNNPNINTQEVIRDIKGTGFATGGRIGLMEGGMPYEGGIMDLESARQMYGLGKLVKKVTRSVKKIAKSPIGKVAIAAGLSGIPFGGGSFFGSGSLFGKAKPFLTDAIFGKVKSFGTPVEKGFGVRSGGLFDLIKKNPLSTISAVSAVSGLLTAEQEEEAQLISDNTGIDIAEIRANPDKYLGRRFRAEGGSMDEPVAKKDYAIIRYGWSRNGFKS
jgi:hypothetical protein